MKKDIKVSIIVPIYGIERYIERCAESLLNQTYNNIEILFINDCTKDRSIELLENTLENFKDTKKTIYIINHIENKGLAAARNTGVDASTGDYLMHVDGDDYLELEAVETLVNCVESSNTDIICFGHNIIKNNERTISLPSYSIFGKIKYLNSLLLLNIPSSIWNKFYNASFYKNSGIRSIDGLNHGEDYAIVPRLLHKANSIEVVMKPLYNYDKSNMNSYTNNIKQSSILNIKQADDVLVDYFSHVEDSELYRDAVNKIYVRSMLSLVKSSAREQYSFICQTFNCCLNNHYDLSLKDKVMIVLLKYKSYWLLSLLINLFWSIRK